MSAPARNAFPSTRPSMVEAARLTDPELRRQAYGSIVSAYWKPVYKYIRFRWNQSPDDAADLAQGFFSRTLELRLLAEYDPERAAFRTWLRACLDHFVANEIEAGKREKRGGGAAHISLGVDAEHELQRIDPPAKGSMDEYFRREWMRRLFEMSVEELRVECHSQGKEAAFTVFERYDLAEDDTVSYAQLGAELGLPVTTVTNHLAAMRRRFRKIVLDTLRSITANEREFQSEAQFLFGKGK